MFEFLGVADWLVWYMIVQYVALGAVGLFLLYNTRFKIGYKAIFVRRSGKDIEAADGSKRVEWYGDYVVVGEKEFKATAQSVRFRKKTFIVDLAYVGYRKFGFTYFLFDWDNNSALSFGGEQVVGDAELVDLFTESGFVSQVVNSVRGIDKMLLVMFIICVVAVGVSAGLGGYLLGISGNHTVVS